MHESAPPSRRRQQISWCLYDFANSGYTTVILTAIFNTYFVGVVAKPLEQTQPGAATLTWTIIMAIANGVVLLAAPLLGAIADHAGIKKRLLAMTTFGCIFFTAMLSLVGPSDIVPGALLVICATVMFAAGENLIAAFLPDICPPEHMGRLSGYGWGVGYLGGLATLGLCLAYVHWAQVQGQTAADYVPVTTLIVAALFFLAAIPALLWLQENPPLTMPAAPRGLARIGFLRLRDTLGHARRHTDLFRFLVTLTVYHCGINTVIVLAAIYAQQAMGFTTADTIVLILVVNVTAAIGALVFGQAQDRFGSKRTLAVTLMLWIVAILTAYASHDRATFWLAANLVGLAMGASQSAGRAMVGQFSPAERSGEFFGLWGLAVKLAAVIGPLSYGLVTVAANGDQRRAILSTLAFFILGLLLLATVNEQRGRAAVMTTPAAPARD